MNFLVDLGFRYNWESLFRVTEVIPGGPADQILEVGDRILQVYIVQWKSLSNAALYL